MKRLTARQQAFVNAIVAGQNPSAAYRAAYSTEGMSKRSVAVEAQKLLNHPNISQAIREVTAKVAARAQWSRQLSIERNKRLNDVAYLRLSEGDLDKDSINLFTSTDRQLNELCDIPFEIEMRRHGIKNAIENRSEFALVHRPEWAELKTIIDEADKEEGNGTKDLSTDNA